MLNDKKITIRNWTILLGSTMTVMAGATIAPALPGMSIVFADVPNADFLVKMVLTIPALLIAIAAPFFGVLLDRWGRKPILIFSVLLYGLSGTAGYFLQTLSSILISRALLGLAVAGIMSGFTTLVADYFEGPERNAFMGYQAGVMGFGGVTFLLLGGLLADVGWRFPFLVYLFAFIVLPGVLFAITEPKFKPAAAQADDGSPSTPIRKNIIGLIFVIAFLNMMIFYMVPVQLPFFLSGISSGMLGGALAAQSLVAAVISLQFHRFKARLSFQRVAALSFASLGIGFLFIAYAPGFPLVVLGLLIGGIGLGLIVPNLNLWLVSEIPVNVRGKAVGAMTAAIFLGQFISPIATEPLIETIGMGGVFAASGVFVLVLAAALAFFNQK